MIYEKSYNKYYNYKKILENAFTFLQMYDKIYYQNVY